MSHYHHDTTRALSGTTTTYTNTHTRSLKHTHPLGLAERSQGSSVINFPLLTTLVYAELIDSIA